MYFITTKRMLEVCFFQHTPTFIIEPFLKLRELHSQKKELIEQFEKEFKEFIRTVEDVISI